jgi:clathrin heavy chain
LNDVLEFWKWHDSTTLAIATENSVYYWKVGTETPVREFNRHNSLRGTEIVNFVANEKLTWAAIIGIKTVCEVNLLIKCVEGI